MNPNLYPLAQRYSLYVAVFFWVWFDFCGKYIWDDILEILYCAVQSNILIIYLYPEFSQGECFKSVFAPLVHLLYTSYIWVESRHDGNTS